MKGRIGLSVYERAVINHMVLKEKIDLSVIITAHNEGHIAHRTMLSIFRACEELEKKKVPYEILVHIDNGDNKTKEYFSRYKNNPKIRLVESDFKDLSSSRNYAAKVARGDHVSFVDADDLISKNWLIDAYTLVRKHPKRIARFSYFLTFGGEVTILTENTTKFAAKGEDLLYCFDSNRYSASILCKRSLILELPQRKNTPPYGYEDWQWLLDTTAAGAENIVVPNTVFFYRKDARAKESLLDSQNAASRTLSPTEALSFDTLKKYGKELGPLNNLAVERQKKLQKKRSSNAVSRALKRVVYETLVFAGRFSVYRKIHDKIIPSKELVPKWLIAEWKEMNKIEKTTFPTKKTLRTLVFWEPNKLAGVAYMDAVNNLKSQPDSLFFVPWLLRGGADKVFVNTANELGKKWKLVVVQSEKNKSPRKRDLDPQIDFLDLNKISRGLEEDTKMRLLALFISQMKIQRIIIGNSQFAYDFAIKYKTLIQKLDIKLYAYAFAPYLGADGRRGGYVFEELPFIQDYVYKVITDNSAMAQALEEENAMNPEKIFIQRQYLENDFRPVKLSDKAKTDTLNILWASRVSAEKLPELLIEIAKGLNAEKIKYHIDVYGSLDDPYKKSFFQKAGNNLSYKGPYDDVKSLDTESYDLFLYTSRIDGMPNALLEMGSLGLPIIAPDVGGVRDLIQNNKTGILIRDCLSVDEYLAAIKRMRDPKLRQKLAKDCQNYIKRRFSKGQWTQSLEDIFDK